MMSKAVTTKFLKSVRGFPSHRMNYAQSTIERGCGWFYKAKKKHVITTQTEHKCAWTPVESWRQRALT
ncbi:unnamed protein product [Oncorhynchus mykiss]|uniref:Uncharacterized protein n=1 Tax=Oncorhynchus mykiss TaxID=8022 RepID=A0A060WYB9_ONCMY|nr:unnamed protein product [Oncorhynchus mykiss]